MLTPLKFILQFSQLVDASLTNFWNAVFRGVYTFIWGLKQNFNAKTFCMRKRAICGRVQLF